MASFDKIKNKRIFEQIIDQIETQIVSGELKPGDQLPSERQISEMMGVHRHSVREALKILEFLGIVESKSGLGTLVSNTRTDTIAERVSKASRFHPQRLIFEVVELRQMLEPHIAALAAVNAGDDDLKAIEEALNLLEKDNGALDISINADTQFHMAIARATHNETLLGITEPIMEMLMGFRERLAEVPGRRKKANKEHRVIYETIHAHDARKAKFYMQRHVNSVRKILDGLIR
jgi:GntR family transcriptional repressor for pyruvate dehydrogenase complex